jgi:hypothetical protein
MLGTAIRFGAFGEGQRIKRCGPANLKCSSGILFRGYE